MTSVLNMKYKYCLDCKIPKISNQIYYKYCKTCGYNHRTRPIGLKYNLVTIRKPFTKQHRQNISNAHKGMSKPWASQTMKERVGVKNHLWKGNNVGYHALHAWVKRHLGFPRFCWHCKIISPNKKYEWANKSHEYKRELYDWIPLCTTCHRVYDTESRGSIRRRFSTLYSWT